MRYLNNGYSMYIAYYLTVIGRRNSKTTDGNVQPDSQWHGIPGC